MNVCLSIIMVCIGVSYCFAAFVGEGSEATKIKPRVTSIDKAALLCDIAVWGTIYMDPSINKQFTIWLENTFEILEGIIQHTRINFDGLHSPAYLNARDVLHVLKMSFSPTNVLSDLIKVPSSLNDKARRSLIIVRLKSFILDIRLKMMNDYFGLCSITDAPESFRRSTYTHFMRRMFEYLGRINEAKQLLNLYVTYTTAEQMILQSYETLQQDPFLSFEPLCQFITDGIFYFRHYEYLKKLRPDVASGSISQTKVTSMVRTVSDSNFEDPGKSQKRRKVSDGSGSSKIECKCMYEYTKDVSFSKILAETSAINEELEKWYEFMKKGQSIDLDEFTSWLKEHVIPYMNRVFDKIVFWESFIPALETVDLIRYFIKDAALVHEKEGLFKYSALPKEYYETAVILSKEFFKIPLFFEYGILFHHLLVKKNFFEFQMQSSHSIENLIQFIENNRQSVYWINHYQPLLELKSHEGTAEAVLEKNFRGFNQKAIVTIEDIEEFLSPNKVYLDVLDLDFEGKYAIGQSPAVRLLAIAPDDVSVSSLPSLRSLHDDSRVFVDKFRLCQSRPLNLMQDLTSDLESSTKRL